MKRLISILNRMASWLFVMHSGLAALAIGGTLSAAETVEPNAWTVPGDVPEMMAACKNIPALYSFSRSGYMSIECGYQAILFGSKVPIAPKPHIPWAKPYAKGTLKVLAICSFANGPGDAAELAQVARELDCDMRFILIADAPVHFDWAKDEAYRLGYLAEQARTALKEDYDVILLAYGSYSPSFGYPLAGPVFPDDVYQKILDKTKAGTGLIFVGSNMGGWWISKTLLLEACPATMEGSGRRVPVPDVKPGNDLQFLAGAPLNDLPLHKEGTPAYAAWAVYDWKPNDGAKVAATESGKPLVICGQYGQGRTVLLGWDGTLTSVNSESARLKFEHSMATALRAITYAAGKEPPVSVIPQPAQFAAGAGAPATVAASGAAQLNWTVRNDDFETLAEGRFAAKAGANKIALPALPAGKFWLDIIARDRKGASVGWGSGLLTVIASQKLQLSTDKQSYRVGETVHLTGSLNGSIQDQTVHVEIRDASGRLVSTGPVQDQAKLTYDYPIADARVAPHTATVTVLQGKCLLLREQVTFFVPNNEWTDYENILWPRSQIDMNENARDVAGITAVMDGWGEDRMARAAAPVGIRGSRMNDGVISPAQMQTDPVQGEKENQRIPQALASAQKYGVVAWAFQDERHCTSDAGVPNDEGLRRYRAYLQAQYKTIAALNAEWGNSWTQWDEIKPTLTTNLTATTKNLAPWLDFRLYVADQEYQADKKHADEVRAALGPKTYIGIDGFTTSDHMIPYGGADIGRYLATGVFNFYCPYGDDLMIASLLQGPMVKYIGWGMGKPTYFGYPWRDALRGHWGTFRYVGETFFSAFGWVQPAGSWIGEGTKELREGAGKVLMGAKRQLSPVAILYSYPSMIASAGAGIWAEKGNDHLMWRPASWSREAFERELLQCGVSFGYVTDDQAVRGGLAGKKLLIIPHFMGMALSDAACASIKQFVSDGGLVVADLAPAICDEHGKLRDKGGLDDLFGVTRAGFEYAQRASDYLVGITTNDPLVEKNGWWIGEWFEKNLKVTDGTPLGKHWFLDIPAFVVKKTGKGQALLMNFLQAATIKRNGQPEDDDLKMVQRFLRAAGITPPADITDAAGVSLLKNYEVNVFKDGPIAYYGVYCETSPEHPEQMQVIFPDARETYDVRAGKYLGRIKQTSLPLKAFGAALFARLDYQVNGLTVTAGNAARGAAVPLEVKLSFKGATPPGRHVVRLEVIAPDKAKSFFYSQNVNTRDGAWRGAIHSALNDTAGTWTVNAREIFSGAAAQAKFRLK